MPANLEGTLSHQFAPPGAPAIEAHVIEPEGQQDGLLKPLIYDPFTILLDGDAGLALVELGERGLDRVAQSRRASRR